MPLDAFTHKYQAQVSLIGIQIKWTLDCEDALFRAKTEKGIMNATAKKNLQRLNELVSINLKSDAELNAHGAWTRTKVETMITVDLQSEVGELTGLLAVTNEWGDETLKHFSCS